MHALRIAVTVAALAAGCSSDRDDARDAVILGTGGPDHQAVVRMVLAAGADPNRPDRDGVGAVAHARQRNQPEVAALLEASGGHA